MNARQMAADLRGWLKGGRVCALEEYGGPVTTAEEKRRAMKRYLQTALFVAAGLLVGALVGSRIQLGGEDVGTVVTAAADRAAGRLDRAIERLGPEAHLLTPEDAHTVWAGLEERAADILVRLEEAPASARRTAMEQRVAFVRGRIAPLPIEIQAPPGTPYRFVNAVTGETWAAAVDDLRLPPGRWWVEVGDKARFPVSMPLRIRKAGEDPSGEAPVASWSIPVDPRTLPASYVMVVGRGVRLSGPPLTADVDAVRVPSFAMDRRKVTRADWAHFLATLPEAERDARIPLEGFAKDATGTWVPATGTAERPVTGIRPADATRFAAWRSKKESARVRLPTDAEWLLAGGAPLRTLGLGDLAPELDPKAIDVPSLWEAPCELTVPIRPKDEAAAFRMLGRADAETSSVDEAMGETRDLAEDARDAAIGFRCVRELP